MNSSKKLADTYNGFLQELKKGGNVTDIEAKYAPFVSSVGSKIKESVKSTPSILVGISFKTNFGLEHRRNPDSYFVKIEGRKVIDIRAQELIYEDDFLKFVRLVNKHGIEMMKYNKTINSKY